MKKNISNEELRKKLINIYSKYIIDEKSELNKEKAREIDFNFTNGANAIFTEDVSNAIWGTFNLSEEKLSKKEAEKILENLKNSS